ncbi:MAG: hypothetical protein CVT95_09535 [Bacteroidetes bacterium HGW-Bacteroidetes-12]|nr:MAG: hypothetical protein CVT95_09535 [Bacteroidetes bacterium HGW-Bacteroidetes-12]
MNNMKNIVQLLVVAIIGLTTYSCYHDKLPEPILEEEIIVDNVSFKDDIQPIFTQNCINCHNGTLPPDLRVGNSYSALTNGNFISPSNKAASILYKSLTGNGASQMPPSLPLEQAKINLVGQWIDQGALNN